MIIVYATISTVEDKRTYCENFKVKSGKTSNFAAAIPAVSGLISRIHFLVADTRL